MAALTFTDPNPISTGNCSTAKRQRTVTCLIELQAAASAPPPPPAPTAPSLPKLLICGEGHTLQAGEKAVLQINSDTVRENGQWSLSKLAQQTLPAWNGVVMLDDEGPASARASIGLGKADAIQGHAMMLDALRLTTGCEVMSYWYFESLPWGGGQFFFPTEAMLACRTADYLCLCAYLAVPLTEPGMAPLYKSMIEKGTALGRRSGKPVVWSLMPTYLENWQQYPQYAGHIVPTADNAQLASWIKANGCIPMFWDSTEYTISVFTSPTALNADYQMLKAALDADRGTTPLYTFMRSHAQATLNAIRSAA